MSDTFNVTATWSKPSYTAGETMVGTITGTNTHVTDDQTVTENLGPYDVSVTAEPSGAQSTVHYPATTVTRTVLGTSTTEAVFIDAPAGSTLTLAGKTWTVSADRKSITATA